MDSTGAIADMRAERDALDARVLSVLREAGREMYVHDVADQLGVTWARDVRAVQGSLRRLDSAGRLLSRISETHEHSGSWQRRYYRVPGSEPNTLQPRPSTAGVHATRVLDLLREGGEMYSVEVSSRLGLSKSSGPQRVLGTLRRLEKDGKATSRLVRLGAGLPRRYFTAVTHA